MDSPRTPSGVVATAVSLLALGAFPFGTMGPLLPAGGCRRMRTTGRRSWRRGRGHRRHCSSCSSSGSGKPVYSRLVTNGFSMSGTALQGQRYMRAFAY